ncbi:MAG: response regulator transcription factor, partial [Actinomadura rubrobrunea]|nr:response regulator transcription factor [Actinomadura rubrobrunea]
MLRADEPSRLRPQPGLEALPGLIAGEAADGAEAIRAARELRPDVVLMDVRMPNVDGIEATAAICRDTDAKVLVLTTFDLDEYVYEALRAGASGFRAGPAGRGAGRDAGPAGGAGAAGGGVRRAAGGRTAAARRGARHGGHVRGLVRLQRRHRHLRLRRPGDDHARGRAGRRLRAADGQPVPGGAPRRPGRGRGRRPHRRDRGPHRPVLRSDRGGRPARPHHLPRSVPAVDGAGGHRRGPGRHARRALAAARAAGPLRPAHRPRQGAGGRRRVRPGGPRRAAASAADARGGRRGDGRAGAARRPPAHLPRRPRDAARVHRHPPAVGRPAHPLPRA